MDSDPVRDFCRQHGYNCPLGEGGLEALVETWEAAVAYLLAGGPQYLCEYLNDLDKRQVLGEAMGVAFPEQRLVVEARVQAADEAFLGGTVQVEECVWGVENAQANGWTASVHWWSFRMPRQYEFPW